MLALQMLPGRYLKGRSPGLLSRVKQVQLSFDSALFRQIFYTTARLGVYKTSTQYIKQKNNMLGRKQLSFLEKAYCGLFAGFVGSFVANPTDLALIRMQADSQLPLSQRREYGNLKNAIKTILKQQGILGLWKGVSSTIVRAMALNLAILSTYDEIKERMMKLLKIQQQILKIRLYSSLISGFTATIVGLPFDNIKTKLQKMKKNADGTYPYKSITDAMMKTINNEGFLKLWVGLPIFYFKVAPFVCISLIIQDFMTDFVKKLRAKSQ